MKRKYVLLLGLLMSFSAFSQKILVEKNYQPDSKANLVNLSEVQVDKANNSMTLFFITKATEKRMKAELMYFDLDFNFIKNEKIEEDFEKMKTTYKLSWDVCPEDKKPLLPLETNPVSGQAVFKKGYIWNYYNWNTGWCEDKFKIEDKVKPKGDDGEAIKLVNWCSDREVLAYQRTGTVVAGRGYVARAKVGRVRDLMEDNGNVIFLGVFYNKKDYENYGKKYTIQKFDASKLEKVTETPLNFDVKAIPLISKILYNGNMAYLFRLANNTYEYIEINFNAEIEKRYSFKSDDLSYWSITDMSEFGDDVYIYGRVYSKIQVKEKDLGYVLAAPYNFRTSNKTMVKGKTTGLQIMKVGKNGIEWLTNNPISELATKFKLPEGEKKSAKPYSGKLLFVSSFFVNSANTDIFISGQSYTESNKGRKYETVYMFHFDNQGHIKAHYSMKLAEKNKLALAYPADQALIDSKTGKYVYWTVFEVAGMKDVRVLYYPRIAKVDLSSASVGQFVSIGGGKYFLDDKFPVNPLGDNQFIFIGSGRKSKDMWFCKVDFE